MGGRGVQSSFALLLTLSLLGSSIGGAGVVLASDDPTGPPPPPYTAPAIVVSPTWERPDDLRFAYIATASSDPINDPNGWNDPSGAWSVAWEGGCAPSASHHGLAYPLLLTEKAREPDVDALGNYGRLHYAGAYTIVVNSDGHCYYDTGDWEADDERYFKLVKRIKKAEVTVTLEAYERGQGKPAQSVSCTATVSVVDVKQAERPRVILGTVTLGSADGSTPSSVACAQALSESQEPDSGLGMADAGAATTSDGTAEDEAEVATIHAGIDDLLDAMELDDPATAASLRADYEDLKDAAGEGYDPEVWRSFQELLEDEAEVATIHR